MYAMLVRLQSTNQRGMMKKIAGSMKPIVVSTTLQTYGYGVGVINLYHTHEEP
jgi:hypothetical protein